MIILQNYTLYVEIGWKNSNLNKKCGTYNSKYDFGV